MIADLKPYPAYKDSGVPWLGDVPEHWESLPHRAVFTEVNNRDLPDEEMLSVTISKGVVKQSSLLSESTKKDSSNEDKSKYKLVCPDDLVYNKMRAWQGAMGVSTHRGIVSPAYVIMRSRSRNVPRYFHYLYRTPMFAKEAERWSYGITSDMWSLRPEHFKMIYTCIPPFSEQAAIVRYLDHVDRDIRKYIRAKQKLIKLLEEQKQAIIHRAVTRGLDPNVPLKPSGVEWLGDVPAHWRMTKLKHLSTQITVGIVIQPARLYVSQGIPCLRSLNISSGKITADDLMHISEDSHLANSKSRLSEGDVVLVRTGRAGIAVVIPPELNGANCVDLLIFRKSRHLLSEYLLMYLRSNGAKEDIAYNSVGAIQAHYNTSSLANLRIPLPSISEQRQLLTRCQDQIAPIENTISLHQLETKLLHEYRTRLIADVVTGKVDVREIASKLPEMAESDILEEAVLDDEVVDTDEAELSGEDADADE